MRVKMFSLPKILLSMFLVLTLFVGFSPKSHAQGIPVTDHEEIAETFAQYIRQ